MKEKVTLKPITPNTIYFPSIDEFFYFMGWGTSVRTKSYWFKSQGLKLPISDRSLDSLGKDGISQKLSRRAWWFLLRFMMRKGLLQIFSQYPKSIGQSDVIYAWDFSLKCFELGSKNRYDLSYLHYFFQERNDNYQSIKTFIDKVPVLSDESEIDLTMQFVSHVVPKTLMNQEEQNVFFQCVKEAKSDVKFTEHEKVCFLKFQFDFYLSLFAAIDLTLLSNAGAKNPNEYGIFSHIFIQEGDVYFNKVLSYVGKVFDISDYELAKSIPIQRKPQDEHMTALHDAQKKTLQEWKKGKIKPKTDTLAQFYNTLSKGQDITLLLTVSILFLALDKRLEDKKMLLYSDAFRVIFGLENYKKYYSHYKKKLPDLAALD